MLEFTMVSSAMIDVAGIKLYNEGQFEMVSGSEAIEVLRRMFIETSTLANMKYLECIRYFGPMENNNTKEGVDTRCFINLSNVETIRLVKGK